MNRLLSSICATVAGCALFVTTTGLAVAADAVKVGFVSIDRILREAAPAKKALQKLEKEFAPRDADLQKLAKQAKDLQGTLEKEGMTMSESDRRAKEADLARMNRDLQRMQREFREDLNIRKNEELSQVINRANKVVQDIAESEKFDLILQEAVYRSARIDITDKVLKALGDK
ncbi:MAG: OmpH family outer membrane protein [Betaproteobacteria bacterium]|nr:OmpH family outer membrane protein [Betaproteobacteria bacterium]